MALFGALHLSLLGIILAVAILLPILCRRGVLPERAVRRVLSCALAAGETIWWVFVYAHEGLRPSDLPLQLCDVSLWTTVIACWTLTPWLVEFSYFAGIAGAGMALLTPDLWSLWPSYPAVYFFISHGGIVAAVALLVFGGIGAAEKRSDVASIRDGSWICGDGGRDQRCVAHQLYVSVRKAGE